MQHSFTRINRIDLSVKRRPCRHADPSNEDLADMRTLATDSQEHKKAVTKTWSDRTATVRTFAQGDQVLVFTPPITGRKTDKLTDRWSGPYSILGRLSPVTYEVDMPERHKKQRTVHVTMLHICQLMLKTVQTTGLPFSTTRY